MSAIAAAIQKFTPIKNTRHVGPIGLECSLTAIHLVQLESDSVGTISVRAMASIPYPGSRDEVLGSVKLMRSLVKQALATDRFHGRHIVTTLPSAQLQIMQVTYRQTGNPEDTTPLLKVIEERIDGELSDYVIDYLPIRMEQQAEERMAIVALAKNSTVIDYLELLRKSGLVADKLEIGPSALRRLIAALNTGPDRQSNVLAINTGQQQSFITVISGARLLFDQEVHCGEQYFLNEIGVALDMSPAAVQELVEEYSFDPAVTYQQTPDSTNINIAGTLQEIIKPGLLKLAEEINRTLIYAASQTHGQPVSRIYLLGSLARWQGMDKLLSNLVKLDVETIPDPLRSFSQAPKQAIHDTLAKPEIALATGLALNGMLDNDGY